MSGRARRVLIVSPHFPPVNAPDMQRVRMSLPYFREFGWTPSVLAVAPSADAEIDQALNDTIPADVPIHRVAPLPLAVSKRFGVGNVALRSLPGLYLAGARLIAENAIDLVYFSTTMFFSMPLGRLWRRRFAVPYVLDIQDPWLSDYYGDHPGSVPPPKYALVRRVHAVLEPWTMKRAGGVIAVSDAYVERLRGRYSWLTSEMCTTLPFGASVRDMEWLAARPQANRCFDKPPGTIHGVYVGRAGHDMRAALRILFDTLHAGIVEQPELFGSLRLHFIGTDYANDRRTRKTVEPIAEIAGVGEAVRERTGRVPYFEGLQLLRDADFLILIGSDDPGYTASKVYACLMTGKPILAVVHERSSLVPLLREAGCAMVVTFAGAAPDLSVGERLDQWRTMLAQIGSPPTVNRAVVARYSAREMTRVQCAVFDRVTGSGPRTSVGGAA